MFELHMDHEQLCMRSAWHQNVLCCARPKKPKKKKQKIKEDPTAKISGPSNAEEAQLMRSVLGFAPAAPVSTPETPTPQPATMAQPTQAHVQQQPAVPQLAAQQAHQAQQAQHAQQAQQAQQPIVQQPVAQQQQQQQAAPIQPQQQSTFRFGFAAEQPTGTPPANGTSVASPAALAPSQEAPQAVAQPAGPSPAGAAEPATEFVARRVFVGGMPFTYEVRGSLSTCSCMLQNALLAQSLFLQHQDCRLHYFLLQRLPALERQDCGVECIANICLC